MGGTDGSCFVKSIGIDKFGSDSDSDELVQWVVQMGHAMCVMLLGWTDGHVLSKIFELAKIDQILRDAICLSSGSCRWVMLCH